MSSTKSFSVQSAASAPLVITFALTPTVSISSSITGDARSNVVVTILNGALPMWSVTLMQTTPHAILPMDLVIGVDTIKQGATFDLTIATTAQSGSVVARLVVVEPTTPSGTPFAAQIASWPLVATVP